MARAVIRWMEGETINAETLTGHDISWEIKAGGLFCIYTLDDTSKVKQCITIPVASLLTIIQTEE